MVNIKKISEKVNIDERTVKVVLESFLKTLRTEYRDSDPIDYLLGERYCGFNCKGSVQKFEAQYKEENGFHPVVKEYISELVDEFVGFAKNCGAELYKPYWEDTEYYEGNVRENSKVSYPLLEFCNITNASDEVLTALFNIASNTLKEQGIAVGGANEMPGLCSEEPYYLGSRIWVFASYENFKKIMARDLYLEGELIVGEEKFDEYKNYITESDREIVIRRGDDFDKLSNEMKEYLREIAATCDWIGNEKLMAYVTKFDLELGGFGNGREDDFLEIVADLFIHEYKEYVGNDFVEKCRFLMRETDEGNKYCYLKYEKKFDDLSESERDTVMKKVINECISQMQRV